MRWATRAGAHIDRAACAWLIRRHLYPEPEFVHEADIDDERFDAPEARGLDVSLRGLSMICADERVLEITGPGLRRAVRVPPPRPADGAGAGMRVPPAPPPERPS